MIKQLRLVGSNGVFLEDNEHIKTDTDKLTVAITTVFGYNTRLYAKINNGVEEKSILIKNRKFTIDNEFLNVGECFLKIVAMVGSKIVATYTCTPLLIKEIDGKNLVIDKLKDFELQIEDLKRNYKADKEHTEQELLKVQQMLKELIIVE